MTGHGRNSHDEHTALHWTEIEGGRVACELCPHQCRIAPEHVGKCGVRRNAADALVADTYGLCASVAVDPVEKKPLYHFHPGRDILSVGGWGCNLACRFCQNHELSQSAFREGRRLTPEQLVALAKSESGNLGVAFTYNEPLIAYEWVLDCAKLLRAEGLKTVLVTNGYIMPKPLETLLPYVDAANVDFKSFDDAFYRDVCGGRVEPVKVSLRLFHAATHLEVTKLLVTGHGDPVEDARLIAEWVGAELSRDAPFHLSRYFPQYEWTSPATPVSVMERAAAAAREHLAYVYVGNVSLPGGSDTMCPGCGRLVVQRSGFYAARRVGLRPDGTCAGCGLALPFRGAA